MTATTQPTRRDPLPAAGYTTDQARAHVALTRAIQDHFDQGVLTPCTADPRTWDADDSQQGNEFEIKLAARLCRTTCPVFELCAAFVATNPPVHGVVAGQFRRHPLDYRHSNKALTSRDLKAEWAAAAGTDEEGQAA